MIHQLPSHPRYTIPMWEKPSSAWVFNSKGWTHNFCVKHFNVWLYTYMVFHYDLWVSFVFFAGFGFLILCFIVLQTVRLWQSSENGNYDCKHILKDHTAEVTMFWNPYWSYFSNMSFLVYFINVCSLVNGQSHIVIFCHQNHSGVAVLCSNKLKSVTPAFSW